MTEPEPWKITRNEWLATKRADWEASGSTLTFEAWQDQEHAELQAQREAQDRAEALARRIRNLDKQIPNRYRDAESDDPRLAQWVDQLLTWSQELRKIEQATRNTFRDDLEVPRRPAGPSLLVLGPVGTGKTHVVFAALRRYVDNGGTTPIKIITAADMYAELRPRPGVDSEEVFTSYATVPLLFIDDLGAAKSSEWTEEINYRLVNYRYNHQLSSVITSNVPARQLGAGLGERVASRLIEMCDRVVLQGQDRRRAA